MDMTTNTKINNSPTLLEWETTGFLDLDTIPVIHVKNTLSSGKVKYLLSSPSVAINCICMFGGLWETIMDTTLLLLWQKLQLQLATKLVLAFAQWCRPIISGNNTKKALPTQLSSPKKPITLNWWIGLGISWIIICLSDLIDPNLTLPMLLQLNGSWTC